MRNQMEWKKRLFAVAMAGALLAFPGAGVGAETEGTQTEVGASESAAPTDGDVASAEEGAVSAGEAMELRFAQNFSITLLDDGVKLVTDGDGNERLLVPREADVPEGYADTMVIRTPVERAMICSTTQAGLIGQLGDPALFDSLAVVTTPAEEWTIPEIVDNVESGKTAYLAWDQYATGDIEQVVEASPDVVLINGGEETSVQFAAQLDEVQIPYISVTEWMEPTGEGQLEWMKLFGALYNQEQQAGERFDEKIARRDELKEMAAQVTEEERPVVAIGMVYDGVVYTHGGESSAAKTVEEAGGIYALKDLEGEGSMQINMEEFLDKAKEADVLIYSSVVTYMQDKEALLAEEPLFAEFAAFQNDRVYVYGKDYYINSAAMDEKFADMVAIIHPELMEGYELMHTVKLPETAE